MDSQSHLRARQPYAIIPAAGSSRRMGADKLLLPWSDGETILQTVVQAWRQGGVDRVVVIVHPENEALIDHCRGLQAAMIVPDSPPEQMRDSVELGLSHVRDHFAPTNDDLWLMAPADLPTLSPDVIRKVLNEARDSPDAIIVPVHEGRRGHPAAFPWPLATELAALGQSEGVNALLERHAIKEIECGSAALPQDVDTPEDYRELRKQSPT